MNLILTNAVLLTIAVVMLLSELWVTRKEDKSISGIIFQIMLLIAICCCVLLIYDGTTNPKLLYFKAVITRTSLPCLALALLIREAYWHKRFKRKHVRSNESDTPLSDLAFYGLEPFKPRLPPRRNKPHRD